MSVPPRATRQPSPVRGSSRASRTILCGTGIVLLGWGFVLLVPVLARDPLSTGGWLLAGPVLHDGIVAVSVVGVATVLRRWLPGPWRGPVAAGTVVSLVVLALSVPLWWRAYAGQLNPGVRMNVWPGVFALLGAVWAVVTVTGTLAALRRRVLPHRRVRPRGR